MLRGLRGLVGVGGEADDIASGELQLPRRRADEEDVGEVNALVDGGATASNNTCTRGEMYIFPKGIML